MGGIEEPSGSFYLQGSVRSVGEKGIHGDVIPLFS